MSGITPASAGQTGVAVPSNKSSLWKSILLILATAVAAAVAGMAVEAAFGWVGNARWALADGEIRSVEAIGGRCFVVSGNAKPPPGGASLWMVTHRTGAGVYFAKRVDTDAAGGYTVKVTAGSAEVEGRYELILVGVNSEFDEVLQQLNRPDFRALPSKDVYELGRHVAGEVAATKTTC